MSIIIHTAVYFLTLSVGAITHFSYPQATKTGFLLAPNPCLNAMLTVFSKLSEFVLRMSHIAVSVCSCSHSKLLQFFSLNFSALVFVYVCSYLVTVYPILPNDYT